MVGEGTCDLQQVIPTSFARWNNSNRAQFLLQTDKRNINTLIAAFYSIANQNNPANNSFERNNQNISQYNWVINSRRTPTTPVDTRVKSYGELLKCSGSSGHRVGSYSTTRYAIGQNTQSVFSTISGQSDPSTTIDLEYQSTSAPTASLCRLWVEYSSVITISPAGVSVVQ